MLAEGSQLPVEPGKDLSNSRSNPEKGDKIWAHLRRIEARLNSIEAQLSTVRRDVNRIDRNQYRKQDSPSPSHTPPGLTGLPDDIQRLLLGA